MAPESTGIQAELRPTPPPHTSSSEQRLYTGGSRTFGDARASREFATQRRIAAGVGWFGIGLGIFELVAPRSFARLIGLEGPSRGWQAAGWRAAGYRTAQLLPRGVSRSVKRGVGRWAAPAASAWADRGDPVHRAIIRGLGLREIATGIGILTRPRPAAWLWSRVVGDMMDLSLLGLALNSRRTDRARLAGATAAVAAVTALDVYSSIEFTRARRRRRLSMSLARAVPLEAAVVINRPPEECYRFWHDLENLPRFMRSIESVRIESDRRSHWVAKGPGGFRVEWDSEILDDAADRLISWRSINADVPHAGSVHFDPAPGGRGTLVRVRMSHDMPTLSGLAAKLFGKVPQRQVREDLRRFKQIMEAGEVPTTRGQPAGRRSFIARAFGGDSQHEG